MGTGPKSFVRDPRLRKYVLSEASLHDDPYTSPVLQYPLRARDLNQQRQTPVFSTIQPATNYKSYHSIQHNQ